MKIETNTEYSFWEGHCSSVEDCEKINGTHKGPWFDPYPGKTKFDCHFLSIDGYSTNIYTFIFVHLCVCVRAIQMCQGTLTEGEGSVQLTSLL